MSEFLFEILAEEIPASVLPAARTELLQEVASALAAERVNGTFFGHSTSRRLVLVSRDLPERQEDRDLDVTGPPASAAFGADGRPTRAAEGFAKGQGVEVESLVVIDTPKGRYVSARRRIDGQPTADVLARVLPPIVERMTFPRMMRWGDGTPQWVRPVHSVVALLDGLVVPFTLFGVETGRSTAGHRTLSGGRIIVTGVDDYFARLRGATVEPDQGTRRRALGEKTHALAAGAGGVPADDSALVDSWAHLVEFPGVVLGSFDEAYLALPEEILVTSMREHQKMLPVRRAGGKLAPAFLAVCDQSSDPKGLIARGNEWVLDARFSDARFFWQEDLSARLEERLPKLARLQFQEKLGDYLKKTGRIQELAEALCSRIARPDLAPSAVRAARLLKADLVTGMVREFTDLQGVVGGLYAREQGEPAEVWQAVYDQYRPAGADDDLPRGEVGAVVALADRLDTLVGLFGLGLVPSGSKDPYALRRAALGVVRIVLDSGWTLDLKAACGDAWDLHAALPVDRETTVANLWPFLVERLRFLLEKQAFAHDEIEAVLTTDVADVSDAAERVAAVASIRRREDFGPLATAFKRVHNILSQAGDAGSGEPDPALMAEDAEKALAADYMQASAVLGSLLEAKRYGEALTVMASLGPGLDRFFTEVMVLVEDPALRENRLALLRSMRDQFARVARFDEIQG